MGWKVYGKAIGLVSREEMEVELALVEDRERVSGERLRLCDMLVALVVRLT